MSLIIIPERILNATLNLALNGVTVRKLATFLNIGVNTAQQAVITLINRGKLYETRSAKQTQYHTITHFINRIAALSRPAEAEAKADDTVYHGLIAHLARHPNRKWPLRELGQQLKLNAEELIRHVNRAISEKVVSKHHVGALALYALD